MRPPTRLLETTWVTTQQIVESRLDSNSRPKVVGSLESHALIRLPKDRETLKMVQQICTPIV